jgi:hypothetical protein
MTTRVLPERACSACGTAVVWVESLDSRGRRIGLNGSYREVDEFGAPFRVHNCPRSKGREGVPFDFVPARSGRRR